MCHGVCASDVMASVRQMSCHVMLKLLLRKHLLTGAASVITHQLSLKGKAAADVAEVAINQ